MVSSPAAVIFDLESLSIRSAHRRVFLGLNPPCKLPQRILFSLHDDVEHHLDDGSVVGVDRHTWNAAPQKRLLDLTIAPFHNAPF